MKKNSDNVPSVKNTILADKIKQGPIVVYGYTNFRTYLKDFYEYRKAGTRGYSYRSFSKSAGFSSPNILKLVIDGKRNLGPRSIPKVIKALDLTGSMAEYFSALVQMSQATDDSEKLIHYETLQRLIPHSTRRSLDADGLHFLSHWLNPTLREMSQLNEFRDDPYWVSRRLVFPAELGKIAEALKFLLGEKFIEKTPEGYRLGEQMVLSSDEVRSLAIRNYHRQMLELARESLDVLPMEQREFGALTLILPEAALAELKLKLKKVRKELHDWGLQVAQNQPNDGQSLESVTQINFQMFPLTKRGEKIP